MPKYWYVSGYSGNYIRKKIKPELPVFPRKKIVPVSLLLYQVISQAITYPFLHNMVMYLGVQKRQVLKPAEKCVQRSFVQKNIIMIIIINMNVVMTPTVRCAIVSSRIN